MGNKVQTSDVTKRSAVSIEIIAAVIALGGLIYLLRSVLLFGQTAFGHDTILWHYPIFQFYTENVLQGRLPFWNPFSHGGEPFYILLGQLRLFDPVTFLTVYAGHFFTSDIAILFGWDRVVRGLIFALGIYIVFRPWTHHLLTRISLIPILLFSSLSLAPFRQDAFIDQAIWVPYITFFLLRIVYYKDLHWRNWLALAAFIGINWQSYMFTGTWIFLLFIVVGLAVFRRDLLAGLFTNKKIIPRLAVLVVIVLGMVLPYASIFLSEDQYVYPPRMIDFDYRSQPNAGGPVQYESGPEGLTDSGGIRMPYDYLSYTGTFASIWDFIQVIAPEANSASRGPAATPWGAPSEAFMYVGLLAWALIILGLVAGRHDLKRVWLVIVAGFGLLLLGPVGGLHRLLYFIYPPLWFLRHTHGLVLIFIFAVLYFFVLGSDRLIDSWHQPLDSQPAKGGILRHVIKDTGFRRNLASALFTISYVTMVFWITRLEYPVTNYLCLFIGGIVAIGWLLRRDMGTTGLFGSLIVSPIAVVLILAPDKGEFLVHTLLFLGIPGVLLILPAAFKSFPRGAPVLLSLILLVSLTTDLVQNFTASSFLYSWPTPGKALNAKTTIQPAPFPEGRQPYPPYPSSSPYDQDMRYLDLIYRQPYALSDLIREDVWKSTPGMELPLLDNSSFESWVTKAKGLTQPEHWDYHQDGTGGGAERYTAPDGIREGEASALVKPSSQGNSYLRFGLSDLSQIRNRYVMVSAWVRSANRTPGAIELDVQDGVGRVALQAYHNSGDWERLTVSRYVSPTAAYLLVTLNVKAPASAGAYFDDVAIKVEMGTQAAPETLAYGLSRKRWSSFFLFRKYFELIHSGLSPSVLEEMFAMYGPMLEFKGGFLEMEDKDIPAYLGQLGSDKAVQLLKEIVIIPGPVGPELAHLRHSPEEYAASGEAATGSLPGTFDYAIKSYDYNSVSMKVSAKSDALLYWADGYDKDWHAYINGKEVRVYRANVNFKAIMLPQGESEVSFRYEPTAFQWGLYFFYGSLLICFVALARGATEKLRELTS